MESPHPQGVYRSYIDTQNRLKLPAAFLHSLLALDEEFFVTTVDRRTVRIYPMAAWELSAPSLRLGERETALQSGAPSGIDREGRIVIPEELQKAVGWMLFNHVRLRAVGAVVEVRHPLDDED